MPQTPGNFEALFCLLCGCAFGPRTEEQSEQEREKRDPNTSDNQKEEMIAMGLWGTNKMFMAAVDITPWTQILIGLKRLWKIGLYAVCRKKKQKNTCRKNEKKNK